jgi:DNA-binding MarR family transcriptional regulator
MKLEDALKTSRFRDARHKATLNVLYTSYWLKSVVSKYMKELSLTSEQFNVMRILKGKHPEAMCVKDIASRMIEKNSNVPRILDKLVDKELVIRNNNAADKRETLIMLTETGLKKLENSNLIIDSIDNEMIGVTEQEAQILNELLEKFRNSI